MLLHSHRLRPQGTRTFVAAVAVLGLGVALLPGLAPVAAAASTRKGAHVPRVLASMHADRSAPRPLRGATLESGRAHFVYAIPRKPVKRVMFWVDRSMTHRPTRVDRTAPYDMVAGTASAAGRWTPRPGPHVVRVRYVWRDGGSRVRTLRFVASRPSAPVKKRRAPSGTPAGPVPGLPPSLPPVTPPSVPPVTPPGSPGGADLPSVPAPSGKAWSLSWADEFNGTAVDPSRWTTCWDWTYGNCSTSGSALGGVERYSPSQARQATGVASLVAQPLSSPEAGSCYQNQCRYTSGLLTTARPGAPSSSYLYSFTYGYVEGRIRASDDAGFWSTFWMLPRRTDLTTDYTHEIDILEMAGERPTTALQTYHFAGRTAQWRPNWSPAENGSCPVLKYGGTYHTYGVDWQPDHIAFYLDGRKCGEYTNAANIYDKPMQIILELMVNSSWNRSFGTPLSDFTKTSSMDVDYVRVWQAR